MVSFLRRVDVFWFVTMPREWFGADASHGLVELGTVRMSNQLHRVAGLVRV